jgi:hypothetical protein
MILYVSMIPMDAFKIIRKELFKKVMLESFGS